MGQKRQLDRLIRSILSVERIKALRIRYSSGKETVAELSQAEGCLPVLLYAVISPPHIRLPYKLRNIPVEQRVQELFSLNIPDTEIAARLGIAKEVVVINSSGRFAHAAYSARTWYNDKAQGPKDPNFLEYDENTLPPTSRLGWVQDSLTDLPPDSTGRCPTCGKVVFLPCLECRVKEDMQKRKISKPKEITEEMDAADNYHNRLRFL